MNYEVRHPNHTDRSSLDDLLIADYEKHGVEKPPLSDAQVARYAIEAWVAFNRDDIPEAVALVGDWKYGDAAPYSRLPGKILKEFGKRGLLYSGETGLFVLSATDYREGGALTALVDETEVLEPKTGSVHVPLLETEEEAKNFLEGRGFKTGRTGNNHITGQGGRSFRTILMTRKK